MSKNLVGSEWLSDNVNHPNLVIIHCGKDHVSFKEEHIPNAVYIDLDKDLAAPMNEHGGRHPLPMLNEFIHTLSQAGIDSSKKVVIYDNQGGSAASRLWWMLKYVGHDQVFVLQEVFSQWKLKGYPTTSKVVQNSPAQFEHNVQKNMLVTMEEVKRKMNDDHVLLIDSRSKERYLGLKDEVDPVAGHIPGAINDFWKNRLAEDGTWKTRNEQVKSLGKYLEQKDKEMIHYCGSGVTACANVLAFDNIGLVSSLYVGSWSDWITYADNPLQTGENKKQNS